MRKFISCLALLLCKTLVAQAQAPKLIDVHIHCYDDNRFGYPAPSVQGCIPSKTADAHFKETYAALRKAGARKVVISGSPSAVENWMRKDSAHLFIPAIAIDAPDEYGMDTVRLKQMILDKKIAVFGEVGAYYAGTTLADRIWQPYLRICQRYDIPVAVHIGGGPPETPYHGSPNARLSMSEPFLLEDVLIKYPKLRLYMMHSGEVWYEHAVRMMQMYPQIYTDLGALLWVSPLTQHYATEFLKLAKADGSLSRVMFGTDQMKWPGATDKSIQFLNSLAFLSKKDKEGILYNNAARFLRIAK